MLRGDLCVTSLVCDDQDWPRSLGLHNFSYSLSRATKINRLRLDSFFMGLKPLLSFLHLSFAFFRSLFSFPSLLYTFWLGFCFIRSLLLGCLSKALRGMPTCLLV